MRRVEPPAVTAEINVTPLVDVVLVLLVIFMVVTPILQAGAGVDLPVTERPPARPADEPRIVISVGVDGAVRVNGVELAGELFQRRVRESAERHADPDVIIEGDARLPFFRIKNTMLALRAAGISHVGLAARQREPS